MIRTFTEIMKLSKNYKGKIYLGLIFNILKSFSMAGMYMGVFYVLFNLENLTTGVVKTALLIEAVSVFGRFIFQWLVDIFVTAAGYDVFMDYRLDIGKKLKRAPMGYFSEVRLGEIQSVLTTVLSSLENYAMFTICNISGAFAMSLFMIICFFSYSIPIGILALTGLLIGSLVLHVIMKRSANSTAEIEETQQEMISSVMEYTRGISILRTHTNTEDGQDSTKQSFIHKERADYKQEKAMASILRVYQMVYKTTALLMVILSASLYAKGSLNISETLSYMIASFFVFSELESVGDSAFLSMRINNQLGLLEKVTNIPVIEDDSNSMKFKNGDIDFEHVKFAYDRDLVIDDVDLKIKKNSSIAVVGPSGSGKTTLCKLIARFWDVTSGSIKIAGRSINDIEYEDLMNNISMVFQDVYLFNDTIRNNIAFGLDKVSDDDVVRAAKAACCHDFIMDLPDGYDTVVGESGSNLSGGEKQRISIARAMLKEAPIIIFDEATSSIDSENEVLLLRAMKELTKKKTVITIAHRLSTIESADEIIVLKEGKIAQRGNHQKLKDRDGVYKNFLLAVEKSNKWAIANK